MSLALGKPAGESSAGHQGHGGRIRVTAPDAVRFLDLGQDTACSVATTASGNRSTTVKPLDTSGVPGLQGLLDHAQDDSESGEPSLADLDITLGTNAPSDRHTTVNDPYRIEPFAERKHQTLAQPHPTPLVSPAAPAVLIPGQALVLPQEAWRGLRISFSSTGADADLTLFLLGTDGRVHGDEDFIFYNQPSAADGCARLLGKEQEEFRTVERATVHLSALPERVRRVAVAINMDVDTGLTCGALTHAALDLTCVSGTAWTFRTSAAPLHPCHGRRRAVPAQRRRPACMEASSSRPGLGRRPRRSRPRLRSRRRIVGQ